VGNIFQYCVHHRANNTNRGIQRGLDNAIVQLDWIEERVEQRAHGEQLEGTDKTTLSSKNFHLYFGTRLA